jgi:putative SOS response-associated peptidase YedK
MCYDIKASLESQLNRARRKNDEQAIKEIIEKLLPLTDLPIHHTSGFNHPKLLIYTEEHSNLPKVATWGLVPHWVKDKEQLKKIWNSTLNARGETIFDKPSFRDAAQYHRCIIYVDGFYEHHHYNGKTYPFFIHQKENKALALAGLWSDWVDPKTREHFNSFTIVTTVGNSLLEKIHNNPKQKGPRMPLILPAELEDNWLKNIDDELDIKAIQELIQPYPEDELIAHTVDRLRGNTYKGNVETASDPIVYEELDLNETN